MSADIRPISTDGFAAISAPASFGAPPRLEWLAVRCLVIDPLYQRDISPTGRRNVRAIAERFEWAKFTPVIVAPAGSGRYAIVDGQHRVTAAALVGVDRVPCAVIDVGPGVQAAAFAAINGATTRVHTLHMFHAACAAGNGVALRTRDVCARAGVTISRYPRAPSALDPGTTLTVGAIERCVVRYGEAATELGLRMVMAACGGAPETLVRPIIVGTIEVLHDHTEWAKQPVRLKAVFENLVLDELLAKARVAAARVRGTSQTDQFEALLVEALQKAMPSGRARA